MQTNPNKFWIDATLLSSIVPHWDTDETQRCAAMIFQIIQERLKNGSGAYEFDDFRSMAYIGLLTAYKKHGDCLTAHMARGYIKAYTNNETRQRQRKKRLDILDSNVKADDVADEAETDDETIARENLNIVLEYVQQYQRGNCKAINALLGFTSDPAIYANKQQLINQIAQMINSKTDTTAIDQLVANLNNEKAI